MGSRFGFIGFVLGGGVIAAGLTGGGFGPPAPIALAMPVAPRAPREPGNANPEVDPGKVHWHATTEAACLAAKASKKPVLVFHMMGRLDHQFC
jgi:hypothetical protein